MLPGIIDRRMYGVKVLGFCKARSPANSIQIQGTVHVLQYDSHVAMCCCGKPRIYSLPGYQILTNGAWTLLNAVGREFRHKPAPLLEKSSVRVEIAGSQWKISSTMGMVAKSLSLHGYVVGC